MTVIPETLRLNVRMLGELLGDTLLENHGPELFRKVEEIRQLGKEVNRSDSNDATPLTEALAALEDNDILPIARAFNQFLNLANIAEQQYFSSAEANQKNVLEDSIKELAGELGKDKLSEALNNLNIELVLTAHPTEVTRRTLIRKYENVSKSLRDLSRTDLYTYETDRVKENLRSTVDEIWYTDEVRDERPTAVDEAKWGFAVIENSLWSAVPDFLRELDAIAAPEYWSRLTVRNVPVPFLFLDGRGPRREPERDARCDKRSDFVGSLDGGGSLSARHQRACRHAQYGSRGRKLGQCLRKRFKNALPCHHALLT